MLLGSLSPALCTVASATPSRRAGGVRYNQAAGGGGGWQSKLQNDAAPRHRRREMRAGPAYGRDAQPRSCTEWSGRLCEHGCENRRHSSAAGHPLPSTSAPATRRADSRMRRSAVTTRMAVAVVVARGSRWGGCGSRGSLPSPRRCASPTMAYHLCVQRTGAAGQGEERGRGSEDGHPATAATPGAWQWRRYGLDGAACSPVAVAVVVQRCHHCPRKGGLGGGGVGRTAWPPRCVDGWSVGGGTATGRHDPSERGRAATQ